MKRASGSSMRSSRRSLANPTATQDNANSPALRHTQGLTNARRINTTASSSFGSLFGSSTLSNRSVGGSTRRIKSSSDLRDTNSMTVTNNQSRFASVVATGIKSATEALIGAAPTRSGTAFSQSTTALRSTTTSSRVAVSHINHKSKRNFSALPSHEVLAMPALSPTMETGTIASWEKQVGDRVRAGDVIAQVVTDKATVSFDSTEDGYIAKILVPAGTENIDVGTPVAIMVEEEADIAAFKDYSAGAKAPSIAETAAANGVKVEAEQPAKVAKDVPGGSFAAPAASASTNGRILASPLARQVASDKGVDLGLVKGTGQYNAIVKSDVLEILPQLEAAKAAKSTATEAVVTKQAAPSAAPTPAASSSGDYVDQPLTQMRKVIAKRLTESKQTVPHYYITVEIQMDAINKLRADFNKQLAGGDTPVKLSVNDFIIKASAAALKKVPEVNSSWQDTFIRRFNYADISVAVSTDAGLITPIVTDADIKGLVEISTEMKSLAGKARQGKLQPHEFQGGTFTISNLGMFGVTNFSAIINPPQAAILAVGGSSEKVVPNKAYTPDNGQPQFKTVSVMNVTASYDHRVVDGATGAQWMSAFKDYMENPTKMLL